VAVVKAKVEALLMWHMWRSPKQFFKTHLAKRRSDYLPGNLLPPNWNISNMSPRCPYCAKPLATSKAVRQHVAASQSCSKSWELHQLAKIPTKLKKDQRNSSLQPLPASDLRVCDDTDEEMDDLAYEFILPKEGPELSNSRSPSPEMDQPVDKQAEDNDDQLSSQTRYSEAYPRSAGKPIRKEKTEFENFRDNDHAAETQPWEPFSSKKEWELATWLIKNVNQRATEQYLNLPIVSVRYFSALY
jgi:hypothetical protein